MTMSDQQALWQQVENIKRRVIAKLGEKPPRAIRSMPVYQAYTALCGEAYWACKENELDEKLVQMLDESAEKLCSPGS
jgi:hypothetical protein